MTGAKKHSGSEVGFVETTKLLLCEATRVVMEKCFQLLGITPESSSLPEGLPQASSMLLTQRLNRKDEPPKINTRFELFSIYPYITSDCDVTEAVMFGQISLVSYFPTKDSGGEVYAEIIAYHGGEYEKLDYAKLFYSATLLRNRFDPKIPEVPLERSMLAVPLGSSIVIEVVLWDVNS